MVGDKRHFVLEEILTEKQIHCVLEHCIGKDVAWDLKCCEVRLAVDGIAGFLGDHLKAVLLIEIEGVEKKVHLFIKRLPADNEPKVDFINTSNFYRRENMMYRLLDDICEENSSSWCVKAYLYTDSIFVMPDLAMEGYSTRHHLDVLDLEHIFTATTSIARFHAAYVNYETKRAIQQSRPYNICQEFGHILTDPLYNPESLFLKACAKVSVKLIENFSTKLYHSIPELETKLTELYMQASDSLTEYKDTVNVIIHKDLWVNNIMFKYENDVPINALLVDYQSVRYAPPVFDVMSFLYLTTDSSFRKDREKEILDHYYSLFVKNLNFDSKKKLTDLGFDKENFLKWCEKARMFGMLLAIASYPFILMDPKTAQKTFDDPETCDKHFLEDRSEPVVAHAAVCEVYKRRNLALTEEFIETYVLKQL